MKKIFLLLNTVVVEDRSVADNSSISVLLYFITILALLAGVVCLQIFLSKRKNKWLGLVLPVISFLFSLMFLLLMIVPEGGTVVGYIIQSLLVLFLANIPTIILVVIYFACREKGTHNKQLDKMNIQDLN